MPNVRIAMALFLAWCGAAHASVIAFDDRVSFDAQGTIIFNSNFSDFGAGFGFPGDPFTRGDVTYTSTQNLTVGAGSPYSIGEAQTVIANNYWTPLTGTISSGTTEYNLFGFDVAVTSGVISITVDTNLAQYVYPNLSIPDGNPNFAFAGFRSSVGEYFTGFRIDTDGGGYLAGMTNVAVGVVAAAPEPATLALLGLGLAFIRSSRGITAKLGGVK